MVFTVGTFDDDEGSRNLVPPAPAADTPARPANAANGAQHRRQPLFTMGSHSEMSDMDGGAAAVHVPGESDSNSCSGGGSGSSDDDDDDDDDDDYDDDEVDDDDDDDEADDGDEVDDDEGDDDAPVEQGPVCCSNQLHACKATTSLSQLGQPPHSPVADDGATDTPPPCDSIGASAPAVQAEAPDGVQPSRARTAPPRDCSARPRKRPSARRLHTRKATALRARTRPGAAHRATLVAGGVADSSYVDYSGSDAGSDAVVSDVAVSDTAALDAAVAPQSSMHSSTATLGSASQGGDSATTTSIDSPHPDNAGEPEAPAGAPAEPAVAAVRQAAHEQPHDEQPAGTPQGTYVPKAVKRSMESQRQQSIVEKEEEDMALASALLTGITCSPNHPSGMAPHVFLAPDSPAYREQIRHTERAYAHVRTMAQPLLASIVRCIGLREQYQAAATSRSRSRALRRPPAPDLRASAPGSDWWSSLLPPPLSDSRDHRLPPGYSRLRHTDLPRWLLPPDATRGGASAPEMAHHASDTACCPHVHELRSRAAELGLVRQQALSANRGGAPSPMRLHASTAAATAAAHETWRGRRIPGLLGVNVYASNVVPNAPAPRSLQSLDAGILGSSSESAVAPRSNNLAPPYRRHGTVYGHAAANAANAAAHPGGAAAAAHAAAGAATSPGIAGGPGAALRRHDSIPASRPHTSSIHESDPRRTSYFDRLSIDEARPRTASSVAHQTPAGLLRRVISGLTGGSAALGSPQ
ncbi:hypothetical protein LPJ61_000287 [Coemansia biformis]|uniref:Uncharacterized protein n=1 Tax=Coemansia biformis TaxID=1286918 RepID=A0A9W7YI57_9FUNG|nr:hypothetical protein LPJ61_000287 [Coemansia biformis]